MIEKPLETFAPPLLVELINDATFLADASLYLLLGMACVFVVLAVLRPDRRERWLQVAVVAALCGVFSDVLVYKAYWNTMCMHAGYYQGNVRKPEVPFVPYSASSSAVSAWAGNGSLSVFSGSLRDHPYTDVQLHYYGARWYQTIFVKLLDNLGGPQRASYVCCQGFNRYMK